MHTRWTHPRDDYKLAVGQQTAGRQPLKLLEETIRLVPR